MNLSDYKSFDLFLVGKQNKVFLGSFPITTEAHKTQGPCGVFYIFQFEINDDHVAVNVKATVPAGLEVSPGLLTDSEEVHSLNLVMTEKQVLGGESKEFHVPPFGNTVFSIQLNA